MDTTIDRSSEMLAKIDEGSVSEIVYLIGFSPAATRITRERITAALPMVEYISERNIDSWYVHVDRSQFEGATGDRNLGDLDWLGPKVLAHQVAVEKLSKELPFFPAHFGTLFSSLEKLAALTRLNWRTLTQYFAEDALNVEWGIKCLVNWPLAVQSFQQVASNRNEAGGEGLNYLLKKKMIRDRDHAVRDWINQLASQIRESFAEIAIRHHSLPTKASIREGDWECLDNWALLVHPSKSDRVASWIKERHPELLLDSSMIRLHLTGPWPLYSFLPTLAQALEEHP